MKSNVFFLALLCCSSFLCQCTKRNEGDRRPSRFEEKLLGKWRLANSRYTGYWEFKANVIDSLSTSTRIVRELDIHIPGSCAGKAYWSLTSDSVLDNSCIPMAKVVKLTNDSLIFRFKSGWFEIEYKWKR